MQPMKKLILLAGAAALASTGAALAKPPHAGQGKGQGAAMAQHGRGMAARGLDRAFHGDPRGLGSQHGYGVGGCPPGLAKKAVPCVPPGQAKQQFALGQRVPFGLNGLLGYNALPHTLRNHYGPQLDPNSRYLYDNSYLYRVDPRTLVVQQILSAILRP